MTDVIEPNLCYASLVFVQLILGCVFVCVFARVWNSELN